MSKPINLIENAEALKLDAVLRIKYPELVKNGQFDYDCILVTKEAVELIKIISKLQAFYYEIDPTNTDKIDDQMCKLFLIKEFEEKVTPSEDEENITHSKGGEHSKDILKDVIKNAQDNYLKHEGNRK